MSLLKKLMGNSKPRNATGEFPRITLEHLKGQIYLTHQIRTNL
jgi:hypothetical protein